jgi:hypothetical protein
MQHQGRGQPANAAADDQRLHDLTPLNTRLNKPAPIIVPCAGGDNRSFHAMVNAADARFDRPNRAGHNVLTWKKGERLWRDF